MSDAKEWKSEHMISQYCGKRKRKNNSNDVFVPTAEEIGKELDQLSISHRYHSMVTPMLEVQFRLSLVPRREGDAKHVLDFDITQIVIHEPYIKQGNGVQFFQNMMSAAKKRNRGVYLEQCITPASQAWRRKLISLNLAEAYMPHVYGEFNAISALD